MFPDKTTTTINKNLSCDLTLYLFDVLKMSHSKPQKPDTPTPKGARFKSQSNSQQVHEFYEDKFNNYLAMYITHVPQPMVNITTDVLHCANTICSKGK